jgi:hypothetical protein
MDRKLALIVSALGFSLLCTVLPVSAAAGVCNPGISAGNEFPAIHALFGEIHEAPGPGTLGERAKGEVAAASNVTAGVFTIAAAGDQRYSFGEDIRFSGINTVSDTTYLFLTGPNLDEKGARINDPEPREHSVIDSDPSTFQAAETDGNGRWSWTWKTKNITLDGGTYTVYAVSEPRDRASCKAHEVSHSSVSIALTHPYVFGTVSPLTVRPGEPLTLSGTADGVPSPGVAIWISGPDYFRRVVVPVQPDATFSFVLPGEVTRSLAEGEYSALIQHPDRNDRFDIDLDPEDPNYVVKFGESGKVRLFMIRGDWGLDGPSASSSLIQALHGFLIDDTYTRLRFFVSASGSSDPYNIRRGICLTPVGDRDPYGPIVINATTLLPVGEEVLVQVYPSSFVRGIPGKGSCMRGSAAGGVVTVEPGTDGFNQTTVDLTSRFFHLDQDEYYISESAINRRAEGTAIFNVRAGWKTITIST